MTWAREPESESPPSSDDEQVPGSSSGATEHVSEEELLSDLQTVGFALAKCAVWMGRKAINSLDVVWTRTMDGAVDADDVRILQEATELFFTRRPVVPHSTPPREDKTFARTLKSPQELEEAWREILTRRRLQEPDDRAPIQDQSVLSQMYTQWMHVWMHENLTEAQKKKPTSGQTSIFAAYLYQNFGGKHMVQALWQTGMTWAPPADSDPNGAAEHVAKHFAKWCCRIARSMRHHKEHESTHEARTRSGAAYKQHGLTQQEEKLRRERAEARRNWVWARELNQRLEISDGRGPKEKGKGKGKGIPGASEHQFVPRSWHQMSWDDQWFLTEFWNGNLHRMKNEAESRCHRVETEPFRVHDDA